MAQVAVISPDASSIALHGAMPAAVSVRIVVIFAVVGTSLVTRACRAVAIACLGSMSKVGFYKTRGNDLVDEASVWV